MNLLKRLRTKFSRKTPTPVSLLSEQEAQALRDAINPPPQPKGHVIKKTKKPEFNPVNTRRGGRVVKVMPKTLQRIKEAQEAIPDEDIIAWSNLYTEYGV